MRVKLAGALIATLLVFGMVFGAGQAAAASLPGEPLYGLKLAAEQARMELTTDPEAKAELATELAENRLGEIAQMVASGKEVDRETANTAQEHLSLAFALAWANKGEVQQQARFAHMVETQYSLMTSAFNGSSQQQEPVRALIRSMARVGQELETTQGTEAGAGRQAPEVSEPTGQSGAGMQAGQQNGDGLLDGTGAQQGQAEGQGDMGVGPSYGPGPDADGVEMGPFEGDGYGPGADYGPGPAEPQNETEDPGPFGWLFQLFQKEPSSGSDSPGSGSSGSNSSGSGSSGSGSSGSNGSQGGNH